MRQEQAMIGEYLEKIRVKPEETAGRPPTGAILAVASKVIESMNQLKKIEDWPQIALHLAESVHQINTLATASGIDMEPFYDHVQAEKMGRATEPDVLRLDAALMERESARGQILHLKMRPDLSRDERMQIDTCDHLLRAGIALRWPQRVALDRIAGKPREAAA